MTIAILQLINGVFYIVNTLIVIWCLLTWFPNIKWYDQPFKTLDRIVTPILAPFKKIIPPIGNIDISAMVAILVLGGIQRVLCNMLAGSGAGF